MIFSLFIALFENTYKPEDPHFSKQLYLGQRNDVSVNVRDVWDQNIFGEGVTYSIIGNGCYRDHVDLKGRNIVENNYNVDLDNTEVDGYDADPKKGLTTGYLGIAIAEHNSQSIAGISPKSKYFCIQQTFQTNYDRIASGIQRLSNGAQVSLISVPHSCSEFQSSKFARCSPVSDHENLTKTLSTENIPIFVAPVGGDAISGGDANFYADTRNPNVIAVADTTLDGIRAHWSNRGTNILCNAPAGGKFSPFGTETDLPRPVTISLDGNNGTFEDPLATKGFSPNGVGAAVVSGIVSLMKEANKDLTPREVQQIIALNSDINDPNHESWHKNAAGIFYSDVYGFGKINAKKAVDAAKSFEKLPSITHGKVIFPDIQLYTTRGGFQNVTALYIGYEISNIEYISLDFKYPNIGNLRLDVISPSGTIAHVVVPSNSDYNDGISSFLIRNFLGEPAGGKWIVRVGRDAYGNQTFVKDITLSVFGTRTKVSASKQTILTDPFSINLKNEAKLSVPSSFKCGLPVDIVVTYDEDIPFDIYLADANKRQMQVADDVYPGSQTSFIIPCYMKSNNFTMIAESRLHDVSAKENVQITNTDTKTYLTRPSPYETFHISDKNTVQINVDFSMQLDSLSTDPNAQVAIVGVWDLEKKDNVYSSPMLLSELKKVEFSVSEDVPHAVLYIAPMSKNSDDGCSTLIQPIHITRNKTVGMFSLTLSENCPAPPGVLFEKEVFKQPGIFVNSRFIWTSFGILVIVLIIAVVIFIIYKLYECYKKRRNQSTFEEDDRTEELISQEVRGHDGELKL